MDIKHIAKRNKAAEENCWQHNFQAGDHQFTRLKTKINQKYSAELIALNAISSSAPKKKVIK